MSRIMALLLFKKKVNEVIHFYHSIAFLNISDELRIVGRFEGHIDDHLTLLGQQDGSLFLGARDRIYNLSDVDLTQNSVRCIIS